MEQDFGFAQIQLILVNDGSTDGSGAICDEYARLYPENVTVIHKENGGVSSARNAGIPYVQGQFVSFMDSDDKLGKSTMSAVYHFFTAHGEETDVAAIPTVFFGSLSGNDPLNHKCKKGDRVIDLYKEYSMIQLSVSSAFFRHNAMMDRKFDERLAFEEDTAYVAKVLIHVCGGSGQLCGPIHKIRCGD